MSSFSDSTHKLLIATAIVSIVIATGATFVVASDVFFILFLAVLFGIFLTKLAGVLTGVLPLSYGWSLAGVTTVLLVLFFGGIALFGVSVTRKVEEASKRADEGITKLRQLSEKYPLLKNTLSSIPMIEGTRFDLTKPTNATDDKSVDKNKSSEEKDDQNADEKDGSITEAASSVISATRGALGRAFTTTFGFLINLLLIFFTGLFLASSPNSYRDGTVLLFAKEKRQRVREIMDRIGDTLWHWTIGRICTMLITGSGAALLLWMLDVPLAIWIGVVTALLTFIPNIGGITSLLLAILFALPQGLPTIAWLIAGYTLLQLLESYLITPLIQQKQAALPPALLIATQALMSVIFGVIGAAVASPLLAATKVLIQQAYIKDVLESPEEA